MRAAHSDDWQAQHEAFAAAHEAARQQAQPPAQPQQQQAMASPAVPPHHAGAGAGQAAFFGAGGFFGGAPAGGADADALLGELGGALEDEDLLPPDEDDMLGIEEDLGAFDFANMPRAGPGGGGFASEVEDTSGVGRNIEEDALGLLDDAGEGDEYQWDFGGGVKAPKPTAMPSLLGTTDIKSDFQMPAVPMRRAPPPGFEGMQQKQQQRKAEQPPSQQQPMRLDPAKLVPTQPAGGAPALLSPSQWGAASPAPSPQRQAQPPPQQQQQQQPRQTQHRPGPAPPATPPPAGAPRATGAPRGPGLGPRLYVGGGGLRGGSMMAAHEVEQIARIQYAATHQRGAYHEDYYALALASKSGGQRPGLFAPAVLRDTQAEGANGAAESGLSQRGAAVSYVALDGLGKIAYSSITKPKPMLEIPPREGEGISVDAEDVGGDEDEVRPLEQEPMLAARQLIEDGHNLLLDIDDITRILETPPAPADGGAMLRGRRDKMLDMLIASMRLPPPGASLAEHLPPASTPADRVLARVGAVHKGRSLLVGALKRFPPTATAACSLTVAACRNLGPLLGSRRGKCPAATQLALACASCVTSMGVSDRPMLVACLAAMNPRGLWAKESAGGDSAPPPPGEVLMLALLACGTNVTGDAASAPAWLGAMERFVAALAQLPAPGAPKRVFEAALISAEGTAAEALKALAARATW